MDDKLRELIEDKSVEPALVLQTRLKLLQANLMLVTRILGSARTRGSDVDRLREQSLTNRKAAKAALARVQHAKIDLEAEDQATALGHLVKAEEELRKLTGLQEEGERHVESMSRRVVKIGEPKNLREGLSDAAEGPVKKAEIMLSGLAARAVDAGEPVQQKALSETWKAYREDLLANSRPLFQDYVEFIRGLALRETGLDEGICEIAEALLDRCKIVGYIWESLTVPANRGLATDQAAMIRLGFPEWTIWAVPLAVRDLGRLAVPRLKELQEEVAKRYPDEEADRGLIREWTDLAADALATCAMGPAYACAAVLLQLDPTPEPGQEPPRPVDGQRAEVIFEVLKRVDRGDPAISTAHVRERLKRAWQAACRQAWSAAGRNEEPPEAVQVMGEEAEAWVGSIWDPLDNWVTQYKPGNWERAWNIAQAWLGTALDNGEVEELSDDIDDVRDILNIAWACRIYLPDRSAEIDTAAKSLWRRLQDRQAAGKEQGRSGRRHAAGLQRAGVRRGKF